MRYHWGLGMGHVYKYSSKPTVSNQGARDVDTWGDIRATSTDTAHADLDGLEDQVEEPEGLDDDASWSLESDDPSIDEDDSPSTASDSDVLTDAMYESDCDPDSGTEDFESSGYKF
ncbi:hypothetical protein HYDPIDRAFT_34125 [Hydnomerulius pinastri MD-312]|uniref:Uncharacterized protein n=1 Tax=Hydnomerulius pinastri MD-312 TaxID=994086 RepID=A0A0C9VYM1_9AGAM|nr:hypothetical protein HYDPIDRAFT_34125 [Hydnomerulius pinastri MD-312]